MKKITSIFFLFILVFNFWGYRWIFYFMEEKATTRLEQKLDAGDYDENLLVELKIPLNLPYYTDWYDYEPHYGETELNGEHYQYVKRKLQNDTLYLLCIPHKEKNDIELAANDYVKVMNNIQHDGSPQKSQQPPAIKLMLSEYLQQESSSDQISAVANNLSFITEDLNLFSQFDPMTLAQPPEALLS